MIDKIIGYLALGITIFFFFMIFCIMLVVTWVCRLFKIELDKPVMRRMEQ